MKYIFIDESGDLGFKKASSKWFLFAVVIIDDSRALERIVKKVWKTLKNKKSGELHATHDSNKTRQKLLEIVGDLENIEIVSILIDKNTIKNQRNKNYLYNYTLYSSIDVLFEREMIDKNESIYIYIDKKDTKKLISDSLINNFLNHLKVKYKNIISITLQSSHNDKSLQVVDFIAWAIFRKYERKDEIFYNLIKDRIVYENILKIKKESPLL